MSSLLFNPNLWESVATNQSPPPEWSASNNRYEFITSYNLEADTGLQYIGDVPTSDNASFTAKLSTAGETATLNVTVDGVLTSYNVDSTLGQQVIIPDGVSSISIVFIDVVGGNNPYGVDALITPMIDPSVSPTPTPTSTPSITRTPAITSTITPTITSTVTNTPTITPTLTISLSNTPITSLTPTPSPAITSGNNLLQLMRRYSDGTLVAKREIYDGFFGYQYIQTTPSSEWIVQHNIGNIALYDIFYNNERIIPTEIVQINNCQTKITFNSPMSGFANMIFLVNDKSQCIPPIPSITPTISTT